MNQLITAIVFLGCAAVLAACSDSSTSLEIMLHPMAASKPDTAAPPAPLSSPAVDTLEITGTVVYTDLEGGFFAIDGDDGKKYDPINLPEAFRKNGLNVKVTAHYQPDMASVHMYGTIIRISAISER